MQFSIFAILALATAVMAGPINKRQDADTEVSNAVMTDADGNIVPFDSNGVVQVNKANGI